MRLTALFLMLTLLAVYFIDTKTDHRPRHGSLEWPNAMYVRQETRNGPLYYPADPLR